MPFNWGSFLGDINKSLEKEVDTRKKRQKIEVIKKLLSGLQAQGQQVQRQFKISPTGDITQALEVAMPTPKKYPQTREEVLEFEGAKAGIKKEAKGTWRKSGLTILARNKLLGALRTGVYKHPMTNMIMKIRTQGQAKDFLMRQGYKNYTEDPEIMKALNRFPLEAEAKPKPKGFLERFQKPTSKYKLGDTRIIDGITYKRNETGQWLPQ